MVASLSRVASESPFQMLPANRFSIEQLTAAYNRTRVDYMVPMPMNVARLSEYIQSYDVDLAHSTVAIDADHQILGLAMLGVRPQRAWITRLGVVPEGRRHRVGHTLMHTLITNSEQLGMEHLILEVIKNNAPAQKLFVVCGFQETRELLILRRPPAPPAHPPTGEFRWLDRAEALDRLAHRRETPTWVTETASMAHTEHLLGISGELPDGSAGWVVFQEQRFRLFPMSLARLVLQTERGDAHRMGKALLTSVYHQYPDLDTQIENIPVNNPHVPALLEMGYVESFRRVEMHRYATPQL